VAGQTKALDICTLLGPDLKRSAIPDSSPVCFGTDSPDCCRCISQHRLAPRPDHGIATSPWDRQRFL